MVNKIENLLHLDLKIESERKAFRFYFICNLVLFFFLTIQLFIRLSTVGFGVTIFAPLLSMIVIVGHFLLIPLGIFFRTSQYIFFVVMLILGVLVCVLAGGLSGIDGHIPVVFILWLILFFRSKPAIIFSLIVVWFGLMIAYVSPMIEIELFQTDAEDLIQEAYITGLMRVALIGVVSISFRRWLRPSIPKYLLVFSLALAWICTGLNNSELLSFWLPFAYPILLLSGAILHWIGQLFFLSSFIYLISYIASVNPNWTPFISIEKSDYYMHANGLVIVLIVILVIQIQAYRKKL